MNCTFCEREPVARDMCQKHYQRWKRTGSPEISQQGKRTDVWPAEVRMMQHTSEVQPNGCMYWKAGINQYGYGKIKFDGRTIGAHRAAWYFSKGMWPEDELDHVCHTLDTTCPGGVDCLHRRCVNVDHLQEVTSPENTRRRDLRKTL